MFLRVLVVAVALWSQTGSVSAQCATGPDGLSGPCWQQAQANLPPFPPITLPSLNICWNNCNPTQLCSLTVLGAPVFVACGAYSANLTVQDCFGNAILNGAVRLDYTRTWDEFDPVGVGRRLQVYRFAAKVDMRALVPPSTCTVPPCFSAYQEAFYYGYVDYALDCDTNSFESALVLFHNCDNFIHHPLSTKPGAFHPGTSYAIVGPNTAANPFTPSIIGPPTGPLVAEAVRNVPLAAGGTCTTEDRLASGGMALLGAGCGCPFSFTPPQLSARRLNGLGSCMDPVAGVSSFLSANTTPSFPWFHMMTTSIGNWNVPAGSYPGEEAVWVDEVPLFYKDSCAAAAGFSNGWGEVYYGASTSLGFDVIPTPGATLTQNFTDLAANTSWAVPGPPPATFMGSVLPTRNLIYVNTP